VNPQSVYICAAWIPVPTVWRMTSAATIVVDANPEPGTPPASAWKRMIQSAVFGNASLKSERFTSIPNQLTCRMTAAEPGVKSSSVLAPLIVVSACDAQALPTSSPSCLQAGGCS
jgi:hypothetical protein